MEKYFLTAACLLLVTEEVLENCLFGCLTISHVAATSPGKPKISFRGRETADCEPLGDLKLIQNLSHLLLTYLTLNFEQNHIKLEQQPRH